ncbi:hypothetical protein ACERK3_17040 [Phycisphaerales bacterium AB-hyl4]|uniref:DUF1559 domain-containing protein n=1 Tax=Natronomicrosphaera hydrolytica TaxID=3242702 RepID=A0ABV4U8P5_9BACT
MVISIIALLIAILLPALRQARMAAASIQCASNQRQLILAYTMYADDNQEYLPLWFGPSRPSSYGASHQFYLIDAAPYLQGDDVHQCSASSDHGSVLGRQVSIGYNFHLGFRDGGGWYAPPYYMPHRTGQIRQPSRFVMTADKRPPSTSTGWISGGVFINERWNTPVDPGMILPRHVNNGASLGFLDGHVETVEEGRWGSFTWTQPQ